MGRYIQWTDVVNRYPDVAKIAGAENVSSSWLGFAEYEVDARLASKYAVPFTNSPPPPIVQDLCIDLTYYKATIRQKENEALLAYLDARFKGLVSGTLMIPGVAAVGARVAYEDTQQKGSFGWDDPLNWKPSEDALDDSRESRE